MHSDVDELVFDAGAAALVAGGAEAEPVVAGQPREEHPQPAVRLHVEPDRAVVDLPTQEAAAVGMPLRGLAQVLAEQAAVLNVSAADERPTVAFARERPVARNGSNSVPKILLLVVDLVKNFYFLYQRSEPSSKNDACFRRKTNSRFDVFDGFEYVFGIH